MFHFRRAGEVMLNVLKAHVAAYKAIKALPGGDQHSEQLLHLPCMVARCPGVCTRCCKAFAVTCMPPGFFTAPLSVQVGLPLGNILHGLECDPSIYADRQI